MSPTWSAPVRYAEADQQAIVFNAHYLAWADEACNAWFASVGTAYADLLARGLDTRVKAAALEWTASARWGDVVDVDVTCSRVGGTSFALQADVRVEGAPRCTVLITYVLVDGGGRPVRVPDDLRAAWAPG